MPIFCSSCGKENRDRARFCNGCGNNLQEQSENIVSSSLPENMLGTKELFGNTLTEIEKEALTAFEKTSKEKAEEAFLEQERIEREKEERERIEEEKIERELEQNIIKLEMIQKALAEAEKKVHQLKEEKKQLEEKIKNNKPKKRWTPRSEVEEKKEDIEEKIFEELVVEEEEEAFDESELRDTGELDLGKEVDEIDFDEYIDEIIYELHIEEFIKTEESSEGEENSKRTINVIAMGNEIFRKLVEKRKELFKNPAPENQEVIKKLNSLLAGNAFQKIVEKLKDRFEQRDEPAELTSAPAGITQGPPVERIEVSPPPEIDEDRAETDEAIVQWVGPEVLTQEKADLDISGYDQSGLDKFEKGVEEQVEKIREEEENQ